jgi:hypothetical protein
MVTLETLTTDLASLSVQEQLDFLKAIRRYLSDDYEPYRHEYLACITYLKEKFK